LVIVIDNTDSCYYRYFVNNNLGIIFTFGIIINHCFGVFVHYGKINFTKNHKKLGMILFLFGNIEALIGWLINKNFLISMLCFLFSLITTITVLTSKK
jgi:hypothetical protein